MKSAAILLLLAHAAHADDDLAKPKDAPAAPDPTPADAKPPADPEKPAEPATEPGVTAPPPKQVQVVVANGMLQRKGLSPELTITGGVTLWHDDEALHRWWMTRIRAGVVLYNEPSFLAVGIAGQFSALGSHSLGVEVQLLDLWSGFWGQGGVFPLDSTHGTSLEATIGYGLFGLEYQRRVSGPREGDQTLSINLIIPLGILRVVLKDPVGLMHLPMAAPSATPSKN